MGSFRRSCCDRNDLECTNGDAIECYVASQMKLALYFRARPRVTFWDSCALSWFYQHSVSLSWIGMRPSNQCMSVADAVDRLISSCCSIIMPRSFHLRRDPPTHEKGEGVYCYYTPFLYIHMFPKSADPTPHGRCQARISHQILYKIIVDEPLD